MSMAKDALSGGKPAEGIQVLSQPTSPGLGDEPWLILLTSRGADCEPTLHGGSFPPATLSSILEDCFSCTFPICGCRSSWQSFLFPGVPVSCSLL